MKKFLYKTGKILGILFLGLVPVISVLLCLASEWMFDTWPHLKMEELVYQLNAPVEGTNQDIFIGFIEQCIPGTILVFLVMIGLIIGIRKDRKKLYITMTVVISISVVCLFYKGKNVWERLDISNYLTNKNVLSSFIDDNYVDAKNVEIIFPEQKRNLIYIYLESMETTYASVEDGGAFEEGCIPELVEIAQENEDFSGSITDLNGGYSMPGTTWTMGGIFAQTSGLPLLIPISANSMDT